MNKRNEKLTCFYPLYENSLYFFLFLDCIFMKCILTIFVKIRTTEEKIPFIAIKYMLLSE